MKRPCWLAVLVLALLAVPVRAQDSPLAQVPADAVVVIQLHGVKRTQERLTTLIKNVLPDLAETAEDKIKESLDKVLEGRSLKGLAPDGPIFLAMLEVPQPGTEPRAAIILRVTNYKAFLDGILKEDERKNLKGPAGGVQEATINDKDFYFVDRKGYAIVTPDKEAAEQFTKSRPGLETRLSKDTAARLLAADLSVYVDMAAVNKQYGDQIKQGKGTVEQLLEQGGQSLQKSQMELAKKMIAPLFQAVEDSKAVLLTMDLHAAGVSLHGRADVAADSPTNAALKAAKRSAFPELAKMPAGEMMYSSVMLGPNAVQLFGPLANFGLTDEEGKENAEARAAVKKVADAGLRDRTDAIGYPLHGLTVWTCEKPADVVAAQLDLYKAIPVGGLYQSIPLKEKPEVKANAEKHNGFELNEIRMTWDLEKFFENQPQAANLPGGSKEQMVKAMKDFLGDELKIWFGTNGKTVVQIMAKDWDGARTLLDEFTQDKDTVGGQANFKEVRKRLPAEASYLGLIDLPEYARVMAGFVKTMFGGQLPVPIPEGKKGKPAFLGMAFTMRPEWPGFDLYLQGAAVTEIYRNYLAPFLKQ